MRAVSASGCRSCSDRTPREPPRQACAPRLRQDGHPTIVWWRERRQAPSRDRTYDLRGRAAARDRRTAGPLGQRHGGSGPFSECSRWAVGSAYLCRFRLCRPHPAASRRIHSGRAAASRAVGDLHLDGRSSTQGPLAGGRLTKIRTRTGMVTIDLTEAEFDDWDVEIVVHTTMGWITVIAPRVSTPDR